MSTTNKKKKSTIVLSVVLAVIIAVGATLAYLSAVTDEAVNAFSFGKNIVGVLEEPNWDGDQINVLPGYVMAKDPLMRNNSENGIDIFTAIRVNFTDGTGEKLTDDNAVRLFDLISINWNSDWQLIDSAMADKSEQIWVYKDRIAPGAISSRLFSTVSIKTKEEYIKDYKINNPSVEEKDIPDWDKEYAWLGSIVMNHLDTCFDFGEHDDSKCDGAYDHHENCALFKGDATKDEIMETAKGGEADGKKCNCTPAIIHSSIDEEDPCPAMAGTLKNTSCHTAAGIDGFKIVVRGAVVQADVDGMNDWNSTDTNKNLNALFTSNPYKEPTP